MGAGLSVVSEMGQTGIPVINIEMACGSSTSAFREAYLNVANGVYDTALVVGFEKMQRGMLQISEQASYQTVMGLAVMPATYALQATRYMADYGATPEMFAQVSVKSHRNGAMNPYAQYQQAVTLEEVLASRMIADPITLLQCSPTTDGAAAVVICAGEKASKYAARRSMTVAGWATGSGKFQSHGEGEGDAETNTGEVARLARIAYERAGIGPEDVDVTQVHDAFSPGEIFTIEGLGLVKTGEGARAVWEGRTEITGDIPVNTDGGLLSRGHPIGATGAAMVTEIFRQLTGEAGPRQVKDGKAKVGLIHNAGIGGVNILAFKR
jgi:benzoylsuccinyl-CoA thiolase BbsB subunit